MRFLSKLVTFNSLSFGIILLIGCTTYKPIILDVLLPPDTLIYPGLQSATIIHTNQLTWINDTLLEPEPDSLLHNQEFRKELLRECAAGLGELLETSPGIQRVITDTIPQIIVDSSKASQGQPIDNQQIKDIYSGLSSDILLVLEGINARDTVVSTFMQDPFYPAGELTQYLHLAVVLIAKWSVYETSTLRQIEQYLYADTIVWTIEAEAFYQNYETFPEPEDAYLEVFYWAGNGYGKRIVSYWEKSDRFYYCSRYKRMEKACKAVSEGDWLNATLIWKDIYNKEKEGRKRIAARAAFNMALASERQDKLDIAQNWAINSYLLYPSNAAQEYINTINTRIYLRRKFDF